MTADYSGSIAIVRQGVTLNCAGHTISGDGTGAGVGAFADGVTVTNCNIHGFYTGILTSQHGTRILGNVLTQNVEGIRVAAATGATASGNSANNNAERGIIVCLGASGNTVSGNAANNNGGVGIVLDTVSANYVNNNAATTMQMAASSCTPHPTTN